LTEDRFNGGGSLITLRATTCNLKRSAVHVEFAIAKLIKPRPGKGILASRKTFGNLDRDDGVAQVIGLIGHVVVGWASLATVNLAVKNLPLGVLVGFGVGCDRELAGTTTVGGAAHELDIQ
jgi:hypothetical protein